MFILQNAPVPAVELPGLRLRQLPIDNGTAKFDLTLSLTEAPDGSITGAVEYAEDRFDADRIGRMTGHFLQLLRAAAAAPDAPVSRLGILSPAEQAGAVPDGTDTETDWGSLGHVPEQIVRQAAATPDATAVSAPDGQLTYRELDERAGRLARRLRERGVGRGSVVGVCLERSVDLVVALVAVQRAGAAYLPLDPDYPEERLTLLTADARAQAVVVRPGAPADVFSAVTAAVVLAPGWERTAKEEPLPVVELSGEDLAYVIYTSGSTGAPKGVLSTHDGLRNRLAWMQQAYGIGPDDRVLQKTPFTFDVSVWEFFWPLLTGARVVLAEPGRHRDPGHIVDLVHREGITVLHFVPSMLGPFLDEPGLGACHSLRHVMCSGEALPAHLVTGFAERLDARLHNLYGPTEASIDVTAWECDPRAVGEGVPIGLPIANTRIHLLDAWLEPVPAGVPGELYIGGVGLARGYLDRPGLTADRFLPDPFSTRPGARLYRTGDRARRRSDGTIEYLGRVDRQVKIRGFRIEPGETETALASHPGVRQAVVTVTEAADGHRALVGYVLPAADTAAPPVDELRTWLRRRLPEHLVPGILIPLDELPLTASGKLDRAALPPPELSLLPDGPYAAPRTAVERLLTRVWSEVLGVERVGIDDNFFSLGGDSIRSVQVLSKLRAEGVAAALQQLFDHQTVRELAHELASGDSGAVEDVPVRAPFDLLHEEDRARLPADIEDAYPLSSLQTGMVFDAEFDDSFAIYHDVFSYHLAGRFDRAALETALDLLVARHPVLRTSVHRAGFREPLQLVHRSVHVPLGVEDLRGTDASLREEAVRAWTRAEQVRTFSWETPPLLRCQVHLTDEDSFHFSLSCHNVILDGWSLASLLTELFRTYVKSLDDPSAAHAEAAPTSAFRDFVALERDILDSADARSFWGEKLAEADFTPLPRWADPGQDTAAAGERVTRVRRVHPVEIDARTGDGLRDLARRTGVPVKSVLFAAHLRVMNLLSGKASTATGMVVNGRGEGQDGDRALGLFLNVVPVVEELGGGTWTQLVRQVFRAERDIVPFRRYPASRLRAGQKGGPWFETAFNFVDFHVYDALTELDGLRLLAADTFDDTNFTLWTEFSVGHRDSRLQLELTYDARQLAGQQVAGIAGYYADVLKAMAEDAESRYDRLTLSSDMHRELLREVNDTAVDLGADQDLVQLFHEQVDRTPDAVAFRCGDDEITYRELDREADRLARRLQEACVGPECVVGVYVERSISLAVCLLAVLKAGAVYLPLEPSYPAERLALMVEQARPAVLLAGEEPPAGISAGAARVLTPDTPMRGTEAPEGPRVHVPAHPEQLAYILFTSGSTGRPKGVEGRHAQIVNRLRWMWRTYPFAPGEVACQRTSLGFIDALWELLGPLLKGVPTVIFPDWAVVDLPRFTASLREHRVSRLWFVPTLLRAVLDSCEETGTELPDLVFWVSSGEALPDDLAERFRQRMPHARLYNLYGTSEVWDATWYAPDTRHVGAVNVPIGRPLWNTRAYVLDHHGEPAPVGVPGELCVGGAGLARGYLGAPRRTAESFTPDPYGDPGSRLYRTGDLACLLPGGDIQLLGRLDGQLKIRGHRVEPGEIEAVLRQCPGVGQAVVAVSGRGTGSVLTAYVVGEGGTRPGTAAVRRFLRDRLPPALRPSGFVFLDRLPLTTSGKLDRLALPAPGAGQEPDEKTGVRAPGGTVEELLCQIWAQVLGRDVTADDHFFDLGDSLLAVQVMARIRRALGVDLSVRELFRAPTVRSLARTIAAAGDAGPMTRTPLVPREHAGAVVRPSFAQQRLWFVDQLEPGGSAYNIAAAARITGALDTEVLERALREVVRRHETLRTTFDTVDGEPAQVIHPWLDPEIVRIELAPSDRKELDAVLAEHAARPFSLSSGPLVRAVLVRVSATEHIALLVVHHIAGDAWSMEVLVHELWSVYASVLDGVPSTLPELKVQYADFAEWQRGVLDTDRLAALTRYWTARLDGAPELLELVPGARREEREHRGATHSRVLPVDLVEEVQGLARTEDSTLFMVLLAAFDVVLRHHAGSDDIVVGTDVAGRPDVELEGLIGFFVNQVVLRNDLSGDPGFRDLLARVRENTLEAYAHQDMPFDRLVEAVRPARSLAHAPVVQIKLVLQNVPQRATELAGLDVELLDVQRDWAQVDLNLRTVLTAEGLVLSAQYDADLFDAGMVRSLLAHLEIVLRQVVEDPEVRVSGLDGELAADERRRREQLGSRLRDGSVGRLSRARRRTIGHSEDEGEI
ncbi:amino acid adenylation domain-containing protein [Streptomyces sp. NPDC005547]|uniref:amino acid adenylation domain-containing protein n=1 Tax=Streptomyces sp. NPDC005547 TaxID=3154887 RepID=UPI0033A34692